MNIFDGIKVIIFDMDGTLINSVGIWNDVDRMVISKIRTDGKYTTEDVQMQRDIALRNFSSSEQPYMDYCSFLRSKYGSSLSAEEIYDMRYRFAQHYLQNTVDYKKDADIFIKKLKSAGYTLVIASTTKRENMDVYRRLNLNIRTKANLDDYFTCIYTSEDAKEMKPSPEIYLRVVSDLRAQKKECLVFEDSLIGIEASKAAGLLTVAVYDEHSDNQRSKINELSNYQITGYSELVDLI